MKQTEIKYTQLLGKVMSYNGITAIYGNGVRKAGSPVDCEKKDRKDFKMIGSKKLYGSTLLVDRLMSY